jgi:3-deoxy-D-manno-octulosonic-acid transferase
MAPFNNKIRLGVKGRATTFDKLTLELDPNKPKIWCHCASLGEYEQGLPIFEAIKQQKPNHQIVLSFFSPSGYEIKKESSVAHVVVYIPLDVPKNAKKFIQCVRPELVIFTKYDIWPNFLLEANNTGAQSYLISALFRKEQIYFKGFGGFMRKTLRSFTHIFIQNETSKTLLNKIGISNVSVAGDTRFDRVSQQLLINNRVDFLEHFTQGKLTVVFGSSWPADDAIFLPFINQFNSQEVKYIIAPHKISKKYSLELQNHLNKKVVSFSRLQSYSDTDLKEADIFLLDTIGYLSKAYSYADIAFVGGASGHTGLHNILEPAVFGIPICIGKHYSKFPEAIELVKLGGVISVDSSEEFQKLMTELILNPELRKKLGAINSDFVKNHSGSVAHIIKVLDKV